MLAQRTILETEVGEPQVVGVGISPVDRDFDEMGLGELLAHHRTAGITGTVIHHADPIVEIAPALVDGSQAISQKVASVVVNDDNEQVWLSNVESGDVDLEKVQVIWRTPAFYDYHWVIRPDVLERYGEDFIEHVTQAFTQLDSDNPDHKEILDLFSAEKFIVTENGNYIEIETVGRDIGMIN